MSDKVAKNQIKEEDLARERRDIERLRQVGQADSLWAHWWENFQRARGKAPSSVAASETKAEEK